MKKEPAKRENTIERTGKKVWEGVRAVSVKVVRFSFWEMAFLAFLLRLLVTPPFGAALALAAGSLWFYRNFATIEGSAKNALAYLIELSEEEQEEYEASLWFGGSGREEIQAVIGGVSLKSRNSKPNKNSNKMNKSKKRFGSFFVAGSKTPKLLHAVKKTLNQIPALVHFLVIATGVTGIRTGRYYSVSS